MNGANPKTLHRLARVAGMFGSANDGEVANAARSFDRILKAEGLTLADVLARPDPMADWNWKELAGLCGSNSKSLTAKELAFVTDMMFRNAPPSPKQETWLRGIAKRFEMEARNA